MVSSKHPKTALAKTLALTSPSAQMQSDQMDIDQGPNTRSRKRKAPEELSTNPNTVKARKRNETLNLDPVRRQVEKAKAADQGAVTYAKQKLTRNPVYQAASKDVQKQMVKDSEAAVRLRRSREEKDWKAVAKELGWGIHGGLYATKDDGNPAWQYLEYESDDEQGFEAMWRGDEKANREGTVKGNESKDLKLYGINRQRQSVQATKELEFRTWQRKWRRSKTSLFRKIRKLNRGMEGVERSSKPYFNRERVFQPWKSPKHYFTAGEKAIWRNLAMWLVIVELSEDQKGKEEGDLDKNPDWIDLPGPASWWPDNDADLDDTGFYFSDTKTGHKEAMALVMEKEAPDEDVYGRIFPSGSDLRVMDDNSTTRMALRAYFSL